VLERSRPGWQSELPFVLDTENARTLVNSLLQQARKSRAQGGSRLHFRRLWFKSGDRWAQKVTLVLPAEISPGQLALALNSSTAMLSDRMELTMEGGGEVRKVASLVKAGDGYNIFIYERSRLDLSVRSTERLSCTLNAAGKYIGEIAVDNAEPVDSGFPLVMAMVEGGDEMELIGQGGLSTRRSVVVVAVPEGCTVTGLDGDSKDVEGYTSVGRLVKLRGILKLALPGGFECVVRTGAERDSENQCRLIGTRHSSLEVARARVFSGMPEVVLITRGGTRRPVSESDILWRALKSGGSWAALTERCPVGEVDLRVLQNGSCILSDRISVLPEGFGFTLKGDQSATRGVILLKNLSGAFVGAEEPSWIKVNPSNDNDSCEITCESLGTTRRRVPLLLRWPDGAESKLVFPFPAVGGGFFTSSDIEALSGEISVGSIIHVTATGVSHANGDEFLLSLGLMANDVNTNVSRCLDVTKELKDLGEGVHELPLLSLFNPISELFSYSADLDSKVVLKIISNGRELARIDVGQFEGRLVYSPEEKVITCEDSALAHEGEEEISLLPFDYEAEALSVNSMCEEVPTGIYRWKIDPLDGRHFPPAMAMVPGREGVIRPCIVFDSEYTHSSDSEDRTFEDSWLEADLHIRLASIKHCMESINGNEDAWQALVKHLKLMRHAHPDCLDTCNVIIEEPEVLVGVFLRAGSDYGGMFEDWQAYLPFRWWQIPLATWENSLKNFRTSVSAEATEEIVEMVMSQKREEISRLAKDIPQMQVVRERLEHDFFGAPLDGISRKISQSQPATVFRHINDDLVRKLFSRKADAQWPRGALRDWWVERLGMFCDTQGIPWLDDGGLKHRRPVLDAIIAQALFTVYGHYPDRESRVLICAMRAFSPDDFDRMLLTTQALFHNIKSLLSR